MHELTRTLNYCTDEKMRDGTIIHWLRKKAEEIKLGMKDNTRPFVEEILGLTEKEEKMTEKLRSEVEG